MRKTAVMTVTAIIRLDDISGVDTDEYQDSLQAAACELVQAFPEEFRRDFRVYDFGFYLHNENFDGSYPEVFEQVKSQIDKPYYLLFGKQTDSKGVYSKIWVEVKLPNSGGFECLDLLSPTYRDDLETKIGLIANIDFHKKQYFQYYQSETKAINALTTQITGILGCCEPSGIINRDSFDCTSCIYTPEQIVDVVKSNLTVFDLVEIANDPDYFETQYPTSAIEYRESNNINITLKVDDETNISLDDFISENLNDQLTYITEKTGNTPSLKVFTYKYPRDCNQFMQKYNDYLADGSELKFFVALINVDNKLGVLGFQSKYIKSNQSGNIIYRDAQNNQALEDELEGLHDAESKAGESCDELVKALFNHLGSLYYLAQDKIPLNTREQFDIALQLYEETKSPLNDAKDEFNTYWAKEFISQKLENIKNNCFFFCDIKARWNTETAICGDIIHTILDICGLIPVAGNVCDIANAGIYLLEGDYTAAGLSALTAIPIAGYAASGVKFGGRLLKIGVGCAGAAGMQYRGVNYCRVLAFTVKGLKVVWTGGRNKLKNLIVDNGIKYVFNGVELVYDRAIHEAHHLIPWALCNKESGLMVRLSKVGWHTSNPILNGFTIPKKLKDAEELFVVTIKKGDVFHASHPDYNNWVEEALGKIEKVADDELYSTMEKFRDLLKKKIQDAYNEGTKLNDYFKKENISKFSIDDLD